WADSAYNDLERVIPLLASLCTDVVHQPPDLVDGRRVTVRSGVEHRHHSVPTGSPTKGTPIRPPPRNPDRRAGTLHRGGQQSDVLGPVVAAMTSDRLARPIALQQSEPLI